MRRGFNETDLPAQQFKTQADARFLGEDEYKERPERLKTKTTEGKKKISRLALLRPENCKSTLSSRLVERSYHFRKNERITRPQDFRRIMKAGRRRTSRNFVVFIHKNENAPHRLGIVAKKEIGQATFRNRLKRYIREFFRLHKDQISGSEYYDIILMIKKGCLFHRYQEAEEELKRLFII